MFSYISNGLSLSGLLFVLFSLLLGCEGNEKSKGNEKKDNESLFKWNGKKKNTFGRLRFSCHAFPPSKKSEFPDTKMLAKFATDSTNAENQAIIERLILSVRPADPEALSDIICLPDSKTDKAYCVIYDSARVIYYNPNFAGALEQSDHSGYEKRFIFLHELGHLVYGHKESSHATEKEADEFAGRCMYILGALKRQAKAAIFHYADDKDSATHPGKKKRIQAVERGYREAAAQKLSHVKNQVFLDSLLIWYPFQLVPGGRFWMGSRSVKAAADERPIHEAEVGQFHLGKFELQQHIWEMVMDENPSVHKCASCPVENISYEDIQSFLLELKRITGKTYRLPAEIEWERAAKFGLSPEEIEALDDQLLDLAWTIKNAKKPKTVGQKRHNPHIEIYDMVGNVAEWCDDLYYKYRVNKDHDFFTGGRRNQRGGGVFALQNDWKWGYRITARYKNKPELRDKNVGFRLVSDSE